MSRHCAVVINNQIRDIGCRPIILERKNIYVRIASYGAKLKHERDSIRDAESRCLLADVIA
jgi:hypothetical protein